MLAKLWFRTIIGWGGAILATLWLPHRYSSLPVIWQFFSQYYLIAFTFTLLASWQLVRAGGQLTACFLYLPWSRRGVPFVKHLMLSLFIAAGGILVCQVPVIGPFSLFGFIIREVMIWQQKKAV